MPKVEVLTLKENNISNIIALSKVNFKELQKLNFEDNEISEIEVLLKVNFPNLVSVNLIMYKIKSILK
jgi:Leucine-rich repeat (LRR) protein